MTSKQPCRSSTPDSAHGSATPSSSSRTGNRQLCQTDELAAGAREGIPQMPRPRRRDLQRTIPHPAQAGRAPSPGRSPPGLVHRFARQIRETSGQRAGHASNRQTFHKSGHHAERRERSGRTRAVPPIGVILDQDLVKASAARSGCYGGASMPIGTSGGRFAATRRSLRTGCSGGFVVGRGFDSGSGAGAEGST